MRHSTLTLISALANHPRPRRRPCTHPQPRTCPHPGELPNGPSLISALADDPDDADSSPSTLSAGDTLLLTFSGITSTPTAAFARADHMFVFYSGSTEVDLGAWSGVWNTTSDGANTTLSLTLLNESYAPIPAAMSVASVSVRCIANSNITFLDAGGEVASRPCGHTVATGAPSGATSTTPLSGDFGAIGPSIVSTTTYDADNGDASFGDGDTLTLTFSSPTDLGGKAVGDEVPQATITQLFNFTPPLAADASVKGTWTSASTLNITFTSVGTGNVAPPAFVGCLCSHPDEPATAYRRCRDASGIHDASRASAGDLSCSAAGSAAVDNSPTAWGSKAGPSILVVTALNPPDDAVYGVGDKIQITFDEPTNLGGTHPPLPSLLRSHQPRCDEALHRHGSLRCKASHSARPNPRPQPRPAAQRTSDKDGHRRHVRLLAHARR